MEIMPNYNNDRFFFFFFDGIMIDFYLWERMIGVVKWSDFSHQYHCHMNNKSRWFFYIRFLFMLRNKNHLDS